MPPIDPYEEGGLRPDSVQGSISFNDVAFHYPSRPDCPILKNLSLDFAPGSSTALVGASGSGKSTIVSLVERFYDPLEGNISLDGHDIKDLNLRWLRSQIGMVMQEPNLFATSVKDNVAHGLMNTSYASLSASEQFALVKKACIEANADGFITKLTDGYDTIVGERGLLLSGGQKQRYDNGLSLLALC